MWDGLLIEYHTIRVTDSCNWLGVNWQVESWFQESKMTHSRQSTDVRTYMQVWTSKMYIIALRILFPAILLIAFCIKIYNSQSKENVAFKTQSMVCYSHIIDTMHKFWPHFQWWFTIIESHSIQGFLGFQTVSLNNVVPCRLWYKL